MHIGEAEVAAKMMKGKFCMLHPEQVEDGRLQIPNIDRIFNNGQSEFTRSTNHGARLHSRAGHPDGVAIGMMIATCVVGLVRPAYFRHRRASEFPAPDN